MNLGSYWFSDKIVLRMYRAQEVGRRAIRSTRSRSGSSAARICRCRRSTSFRIRRRTRSRRVAIRAMRPWRRPRASCQALREPELEGVIAHELAHVKNRDILISSIAATIAAAIMMVARMAMFFGGSRDDRNGGTNPIVLIGMMILAPLAAVLIQMAISRSREFAADATRRGDCRQPVRARRCASENRRHRQARSARGQSGHRPHVHHQAVHRAAA